MKNEYFLILLIISLRAADAITSYLPAKGLVPGVGEVNPIVSLAIQRWGVFWAFVTMTAISIAFVLAFVAGTHLEEARRAGKTDLKGIIRIRKFRTMGLVCLCLLSAIPLLLNLIVGIDVA